MELNTEPGKTGYDCYKVCKEIIKNYTYFWQLCLNNPKFKTLIREDDPNCFKNNFYDTHFIAESFKVTDLIVNLYKKY